jgi:uncharacterized membrane protein YjgN (DUF898 family)
MSASSIDSVSASGNFIAAPSAAPLDSAAGSDRSRSTLSWATEDTRAFREAPVQFSGKASEFFGIWIVNLLLSLITLGIYSAWAKVRTHRYFYGHTRIEGQTFRYLATPGQLLVGRIIAVMLFAAYFLLNTFAPLYGAGFSAAMLFIFPALMIAGLRFRMRMTSYRNVRFAFHGSYKGALMWFAVMPVASVFTLFLLLPWVLKQTDQYLRSNTSYGGVKIQAELRTRSYYLAALMFVLTFAVILLAIIGVISVLFGGVPGFLRTPGAMPLMNLAIFALNIAAGLAAASVYQAIVRNHQFARSRLPGVARFQSRVKVLSYLWLALSNVLLVMLTLSLAYPWAKVRKARFLAAATTVLIDPGADALLDTETQKSSALGEEAAGFFDVDLSMG